MAYIVRGGDSLSKIARSQGISLSQLLKLNPQIKNPNLIFPGQQINTSGGATGTGTTRTPRMTIEEEARKIAEQVTPITQSFEELFPFQRFFDAALAREGASQEAGKYFQPIEQRGMQNIMGDFAGRGLFRSGLRGREQREFGQDIADARRKMIEQLFTIREREGEEEFAEQRKLFEKDPGKFTLPETQKQPLKFAKLLNN